MMSLLHVLQSDHECALGPTHTFHRDDVRTTIDYIMMDVGAASLLVTVLLPLMMMMISIPLTIYLLLESSPVDLLILLDLYSRIRIDWSIVELLHSQVSQHCSLHCLLQV